jgi:cytochrome c-type biogenesis protein CcmE
LVAIAVTIGGLLMYSVDFSTYDTIQSAKNKPGKYVHLIARLDKNQPIQYDAIKDPNYLSFYATDSLGGSTKVIYKNTKPSDLEQSERIVLKGRMNGSVFECDNILLKCPSKYKDDKKQLEKTVSQSNP